MFGFPLPQSGVHSNPDIMKISFVTDTYSPQANGVATTLERLVKGLREREHEVDVIGLSGLITPSLDEMVFVASEMERRGFTKPLLIGGATTSRVHTAVKIAPNYSGPTIHVLDASRSVPVVQRMISDESRPEMAAKYRAEYEELAAQHAKRKSTKRYLPYLAAANNSTSIDWKSYEAPTPVRGGRRSLRAGAEDGPQAGRRRRRGRTWCSCWTRRRLG